MKIAVSAVTGKLGAQILKAVVQLVGEKNVIGLARKPSKASDLGVTVLPGDYNNPADLEYSLKGVDVLLLVSGMDHPDQRIIQHRNVIESAKKSGVKKIVYTSVQGAEEGTAFSPVIQSNRQTEKDIQQSGLDWVIGRNGIYIEPDLEYIDRYKKTNKISNCAGDGKCGYTTREELAYAYAQLLTQNKHNGQVYNLHGDSMTQYQLASFLNHTYSTNLRYEPLSVEQYQQERINELGDFIGPIIAGIYQGIREGKSDNKSDYLKAAGRAHIDWETYFINLKIKQNEGK